MTRAALLTFLTLCYARVSLVDAGKGTVATCAAGGNKVQATPLKVPGVLVLRCPDEAPTIKPEKAGEAADAATCYTGPEQKTGKVGTMIPGATCVPGEVEDSERKLSVVQLPNGPVSLFFYCEKKDGDELKKEGCYIEVKVAGSPELGPNTCAVENTEIVLRLSKPNDPARFRCGSEATLFPKESKKAYDSSCSNLAVLSDDISLTTANGLYEVSQRKLLSKAEELCFYCAKKRSAEKCIVRVHIAGGGEGAATLSANSRAASALGLALLVASYLYIY